MRREPHITEDLGNLAVIVLSAAAAGVVTLRLLAAPPAHADFVYVSAPEPPAPSSYVDRAQRSAGDRLYGTVTLRNGLTHTGFIRWDRNEASWADVLDATKLDRGSRLAGIRFGHIDRIDVLGRNSALLTLGSGEAIELHGHATDLGTGLRALRVDDPGRGHLEARWNDLETVDFHAAPAGIEPSEGRIHGTLTTRGGLEFTGHVTWDVDEVYSSDMLDGDLDGERVSIPFGAIASIARNGSRSARVILHTGEQLVLDGTNDVDRSNRGIAVSDYGLGEVKAGWDQLEVVRFQATYAEPGFEEYTGGDRLRGTVVTADGEELSGEIRWDDDEAYTWELLNGSVHDDVELQIELGNVERIERSARGARVDLRDGRSFELFGSNDVDRGNDGVVVETAEGTRRIAWNDFRELRLEG